MYLNIIVTKLCYNFVIKLNESINMKSYEMLQQPLYVILEEDEGEEKVAELSLVEIKHKVLEAIKKDDVNSITPFFKGPMDTNMWRLTRTSIMDAADFGSIKCAKFIISFYPDALNMKDADGRLPVDRANSMSNISFVNACWAARCEIAEAKRAESSSKRQKISHDESAAVIQL